MNIRKLIIAGAAASTITFAYGKEPVLNQNIDKSTLGPAEAVQQWSKDAQQGNISSLWNSLPANYQTDVESLAHLLGKDVDAEIYNEVIKTLTAANNLLKNKKGFMVEILEEMGQGNKEVVNSIKNNYDGITNLLTAVLNSDIKTAQGLQNIDISKFTSNIEPQLKPVVLAAKPMMKEAALDTMKAVLVSENGNKAVAKVSIEGEDPEEVELEKVNKRWVPAEMAAEWDEMIKTVKDGMKDNVAKMKPANKVKVKMVLTAIQGTIAEMEKAESKEEMMEVAQGMMKGMMQAM